jgi:MoxR-like ATPase
MDRMGGGTAPRASKIIGLEHIARARELVHTIYMDEKVKDYILNVVFATREPGRYGLKDLADYIQFGASPRATIALSQAARAHAFLRHRGFVTPEDVKAVAFDVLRHRVTVTYEAEAEELSSEKIIQRVFDRVEVP